ncbi:RnfH family protein [Undibacterium sp. TS12]|uniref:RnfH family protein n=1 Tax=Undibacterium sp. TS12 TaxID=2908202 RepID=UPI001F4CA99E|nr:RnfH family protein [Undibacterium sp. TS12]MCH8621759.1 RnfH family protein [Undibacterium sp. TS12]
MGEPEIIAVQVAYAGLEKSSLLDLDVSVDATLLQVIQQSGIIKIHPEIDISVLKVGIFGKLKPLDARLHPGDRVEIYRPLIADPMEARRRRAKKQARS